MVVEHGNDKQTKVRFDEGASLWWLENLIRESERARINGEWDRFEEAKREMGEAYDNMLRINTDVEDIRGWVAQKIKDMDEKIEAMERAMQEMKSWIASLCLYDKRKGVAEND